MTHIAHAQVAMSPYTVPGSIQYLRLNPAMAGFEGESLHMALGHFNFDFNNSSGDIIKAVERRGDELFFNIDALIGSLDKQNSVYSASELTSFYAGTQLGRLRIGLFHALRYELEFVYPKEMIELLWFGNGRFIGEEIDIAPNIWYNAYNQIGLHGAFDLGNFQIGASLSRLYGTAYIHTIQSELAIYTDPDFYEISIDNNYQFESASSIVYEEPYTVRIEDETFSKLSFSRNGGWSLDLGVSTNISDKLQVHASIRDLGSMTYEQGIHRYGGQGEFQYTGVELQDGLLDRGIDYDIDLDTILEELDFVEIEAPNEVKVKLSSNFSFGVNYDWTERTRFSILFIQHTSSFAQEDISMFHTSWHQQVFNILRTNLNYSYKADGHNLGLGMTLEPGPFQFMLYTDNMLTIFNTEDGPRTAIFGGMNFRL